ncbi:16S rRNA (cytosine(1402)-N(4))-methyltransferase RsmH [Patescibacteria group bacterium]|nr:16S rRNA (cytosine(1402)-N(4))-methyltransferase RsmH [Patescibacteria group bacterium]
MEYKHIPVMLAEVIEYLKVRVGGFYIDCTLGGGGYTKAIASIVGENGKVFAVDVDALAIKNQKSIIKSAGLKNIELIQGNFKDLKKIIKEKNKKNLKFNGVVLDLGLSSAQLDDRNRGISFKYLNAPLDMAFGDSGDGVTEDIINYYSERDLERIIKEYGEERFARRIAGNIAKERVKTPIKTVGDLVEIINFSIPKRFQTKNISPATRTFQALRIETNKELESLKLVLPQAVKLLKKGGKLVVVSYHSLEDKIVKNYFKDQSKECICLKEVIVCDCNYLPDLKILTKKPIAPTAIEININNRARSAKMRVAEKIK